MNKKLAILLIVTGSLIAAVLLLSAGFMIGQSNVWANHDLAERIPAQNMPYGGFFMHRGYPMMGAYQSGSTSKANPLTLDEVKPVVENYLKRFNNPDLELKEIMIFSNNAYARIVEKSTGIGAMELLVDPDTMAVFPEYGPNMMWNLKYGHMGRGGMMAGFFGDSSAESAKMSVTPEQALTLAQQYLDQQLPGYKTAADADPFYGYYTIDIMKDGQPSGMLSVNGATGQVFLHTWHGTFISMWE